MSDLPMSGSPEDDAARSAAPGSDRAALETAVVESVSVVPGVARLVPSFRQVLTETARRLLNAETSPATGVDIVTEASGVVVYVDLYTDGTRPAGSVVDDVAAEVQALILTHEGSSAQVKVRVMGVMDAG